MKRSKKAIWKVNYTQEFGKGKEIEYTDNKKGNNDLALFLNDLRGTLLNQTLTATKNPCSDVIIWSAEKICELD
jgi:plastocyanin domain-containing protein